jgi:ubiquitin-protein ligase
MDHSVILTFYTHGSVDDDYEHFGYMMDTFTLMLSIAWHILNEHHCISALIQIPYNYPVHPPSTMCWN